ncbi:MAG: type IV toxin-antitoxin system AbiEi family antitoxin domain-containing protein [Solirubrobacterales bacterium]|nr:type IV toxin-antitoxin system AbiEi family antitoxin domain-containing protein [Solirubrobacterales bacterium]
MEGKRNDFRAIDGKDCGFRLSDDRKIAAIARRQRGHVTRAQLISAGITGDAIDHRLQKGRLTREHDGVYAYGFSVPDHLGRATAALLAVGEDGVLSHLAAGAAYELCPDPLVIDITCRRRLPKRRGIPLHHHDLAPQDVRHQNNLPLTSTSQTLFDLSTLLSLNRLTQTANEAFVQRLCTMGDLHNTATTNAGRTGSVRFRELLATLDPEGRRIRSPLEARLNAFLRVRGFPPWESNVRLRVGNDVIEADVLWCPRRVIVEADGRDPHLSPLTFASDRRRDRRSTVEGWHTVRVTSNDLGPGADELDADLRILLDLSPRL